MPSDEKKLSFAASPAASLMQPLPLPMVEDALSDKKREQIKFVVTHPAQNNGWLADQLGIELDDLQKLMSNPKAREYARSYMASVMDDVHTTDDLLKLSLRELSELARTRPQDYAELDEEGIPVYSLEKLKNAPPGVVIQLDLSRGKVRPTFVDSLAARTTVTDYYSQLVAGKSGRADGGVNVNIQMISTQAGREALRASLRGELNPAPQETPVEAEVSE